MTQASVSGRTHAEDATDDYLASDRVMGVKAVGAALRRARGRLSQSAAAERWNVPLATMAALEQGVVRDYQAQTLAQFDEMLGTSTLDLYEHPDEEHVTPSSEHVYEVFLSHSRELADSIAQSLRATLSSSGTSIAEVDELLDLYGRADSEVRLAILVLLRSTSSTRK